MENDTMNAIANDDAAMSEVLAHVAAMKRLAREFELQAADEMPGSEQLHRIEAALGAASELQRAAFALAGHVQLDHPRIVGLLCSAFARTHRLMLPLFAAHVREPVGAE